MQLNIHRYNIAIYVCHIIIKWNAIYIATMVECIMTVVTFNMFITVVYFILDKKNTKQRQQRLKNYNNESKTIMKTTISLIALDNMRHTS